MKPNISIMLAIIIVVILVLIVTIFILIKGDKPDLNPTLKQSPDIPPDTSPDKNIIQSTDKNIKQSTGTSTGISSTSTDKNTEDTYTSFDGKYNFNLNYTTPYTRFDKISDNIYLGNRTITNDELTNLGITKVIRLMSPGTPIEEYSSALWNDRSLIFALYDSPDADIIEPIKYAVPFMDKEIATGGKIYVHCHAGISRSASIVIAYLMAKNKWDFHTTEAYVRKHRSVIDPNDGFVKQIIDNTDVIHKLI